MSKGFAGFTAFVGFLLLAVGVWFTIIAFEKTDPKWEPKKLTDHKDKLKYVGPSMIGLGLLLLVYGVMAYNKASKGGGASSNFGFKFY